MRVLQICAAYKPAFVYGGPTMSVSMLSEQLVKAGFSTEVFATTANGKNELPVEPGVPVIVDGVTVRYFKRITKDHTHLSPALLKTLWKECRNFDLVHIHAWWNLVSLFSCTICLMRGVPVLISPRGTLSSYSFQNRNIGPKWLLHHLWGKFLLSKSSIHVTSQQEKEAITKLIGPKSITMLPNFVKLPARKRYAQKAASPVFRLLFFSRIEEKKGLDLLLNALSDVTVPYSLTIAGAGEEEYINHLKAIAINSKIDSKIHWAGFFNEDKFDLLYDNDLFVLPSHDENFGNAVIESLSVGTPVLISEHVGLAGYVAQNSLGWVCKTTPASISQMITDIAANQTCEIERIRAKAPDIIYKDFDEGNLVKEYRNMYQQLIS